MKPLTVIDENPYRITARRLCEGHLVEYRELLEACQGGVELGYLYIDGVAIDSNRKFGGPPLCHNGYLYAPRYERGWFSSGHVLCEIDLQTRAVSELTPRGRFKWPHRIRQNLLYFFSGAERANESFVELPNARPESK